MVGSTVSHYKILEKLGEGGMGVVYKAQDTRLDRTVALKFLPAQHAPVETEQARFLQEARAASALNHPNVCHINAIVEADGQQFIDMEYVDGATLREKIPIAKPNDVISYALQIGEALHEAHSAGIVHRDIKCENIMVNARNQIKVMDFGLAKLKGSLKLTRTSSTVGTLAYMAPEQLQGGEVDARSDIFSFGVVVFEMFTGKLPFQGEHEAAMMYSILNETPDAVLRHRPDISPEIDRILERAMEKDPADRYQHVDDMVSELRRLQKQTSRVVRPEAPQHPAQKVQPDHAPRSNKRAVAWISAASVIVLAGAAALWMFKGGESQHNVPQEGRKMLAVLPFENLGPQDQDYFADGMTEEITSKLSGLSGLGVIARSSAMQYKKTTKSIKQIGEELGVSYILQGTIRWENDGGTNRVRVNPQLISVGDGTQIWSQPSEAVVASAFKLQSEIAGEVASALNVTLLQGEQQALETKLTDNAGAYDAYLRGMEYLLRSTTERDYRIAEPMFEKAIELDPRFMMAYAKLAALHSHIYWEMYDHTESRIQKCKAAAERALQLDPNSPDAHGAMGWYYYHCLRDYENGLREFTLALKMQPNNTELLDGAAAIYRRKGEMETALQYFKHAEEIDPRSAGFLENVAITNLYLRNYADAAQNYDKLILLTPDVAEVYDEKALCMVLDNGDFSGARQLLDKALRQKVGREDEGFVYVSVNVDMFAHNYTAAIAAVEQSGLSAFDDQDWHFPKELLLAQLYGFMGQRETSRSLYDSSRVILERELGQRPDDARLHSSLGLAYAGLGRKELAVKEGKRGVELMPVSLDFSSGPRRLLTLAEIYAMVGEADAAAGILEHLLSIPYLVSVPLLRLDPTWEPLKGNRRFENLVAVQ